MLVTVDINTIPKFVKEAEIKHGRVAMLSSVAIPFLDNVNEGVLGINFMNSLDPAYQITCLGIFGCSEISQIIKSYKFPNSVKDWFVLKDEHEPGNYNFDPLNISNDKNAQTILKNEMFVGRLSMLAVACEFAKELDGYPVF